MMLWCPSSSCISAELATSELLQRVQRLEAERAELRSRIDNLATVTVASIGRPADALDVGIRIEPSRRRGRTGGIARASQAARLRERWSNGQFMTHADSEQIEREVAESEYMRHAAGGFARATAAERAPDGTFMSIRYGWEPSDSET